jgi:hypothetical protein
VSSDLPQRLAAALAPSSEYHADLAADAASEITPVSAAFLRHYRIYRVEHRGRHRPVAFYAGYAPGAPVYLLTGEPGNYVRLAGADGVTITEPGQATDYAVTYLEVTRPMTEVFYVISSADEMTVPPEP